MTTVYLHIGMPKTGTTALQTFLTENREVMTGQGYHYPELNTGLNSRFRCRNGHFLAHRSDKPDAEAKRAEEEAVWKKGFALLAHLAQDHPNIILSDEAIWKIATERERYWAVLADSFEKIGCRLKIVAYLRRQDLFIQSIWNQNIKSTLRWTKTFDHFIKHNAVSYFPMDYHRHLTEIAEHVGAEDISVRVYENGQFEGNGGTIQSDFLQCLGLEMTDLYTIERERSNLSLQGNFIEIKRIANSVPEYRAMDDFIRPSLELASHCRSKGAAHARTSMFSYEEQKRFLEQYESSNKKVAEQFLGRPDGRLFYEPVEECPKWKMDPDTIYRDIILFFTEVACAQQNELNRLKKDTKSLLKIKRLYQKMRDPLKKIYKGNR